MELCWALLQASVKVFRLAPPAKVTQSQSGMAAVSCFCMWFCTRQVPDCMPLGLHSSAFYKPGIAFRSPSDIERGHFPDRPTLLCRAELQRELDKTRGLETFLIALPRHYLLGM